MQSFLIFIIIAVMFPVAASAADWTLPADFASNTTDYPPANSLPVVTTPGALTTASRIQAGGDYYLASDIYARADGFAIEADNVTLDLRGHKIVYAGEGLIQSYGIAIPAHYVNTTQFPRGYVAAGGAMNTTIKDSVGGGKIIKASNTARKCSGIYGYGDGSSGGLTVENVTFDHSGIDASGVELFSFGGAINISGITTEYNYVRDGVPIINPAQLSATPDNVSTFYWVTNRHSGWVAGIKITMGRHTSSNINGNTLLGSPQWGLVMNDLAHITGTPTTRDATFFNAPANFAFKNVVANNSIEMNTKATNGYGLGLSSDKTHAYKNTITGYGAGISLGAFYGYIHDNTVNVSQGSNPEYPTRLWAHGLKFEGEGSVYATQQLVSNNSITVTSRGPSEYKDTSFWYIAGTPNTYFGHRGEARVLDLTVSATAWNEIRGNTFRAVKGGEDHIDPAMSLRFTSTIGIGDGNEDMLITGNTFESNDSLYTMDVYLNDGGTGPDFSGISITRNNYRPLTLNGVSGGKIFSIFGNYAVPPMKIKNPSSDTVSSIEDSQLYTFGGTHSGEFQILYDERFCGSPSDILTISSPQLGVIFDGAVGDADKTIPLVYRSVVKNSSGVVSDVTPAYSLSYTRGGVTHTDSDWTPDSVDEFCATVPARRLSLAGRPIKLAEPGP